MSCCWAGFYRYLLPEGSGNSGGPNHDQYLLNDWGVCPKCNYVVANMLKNHVHAGCMGATLMKGWCQGAELNKSSTMTHIVNWKSFGIFSPRIFVAMCDYGVTPFMLENYTMDMIKLHCLKMLTDNPEDWPFYRTLIKVGYNAHYDLLKVKVTTGPDRFVFDEHADSDNPIYEKQLTKFMRGV